MSIPLPELLDRPRRAPRSGAAATPGATGGRGSAGAGGPGGMRGRTTLPGPAPPAGRDLGPAPAGPLLARRRSPAAVCRWGVLWAVVLGAGAVGGPVGLAIVMTPVVAVAATSGARLTEVRRGTRGLLAVVAVLVPLTAIAGPTAWAGGSLVAVVAGWGILAASGHRASSRVLALACVPAIAAGSVVAASREDSAVAAMLIAVVCLFDAGNFVVGTGETGGVAGALAGSALVAVAMVILASLVDANLRGRPIAVLAAVAVVAFPLGVALGRRLTGPRPLPAFRRLDSLLFAGPAWLAAMAVVLPH